MHLYVFWRMASVPFIARHLSPLILAIMAAILWASFLLPRFFESRQWESVARILEIIGSNWLGVLFLLFFCLLVADIVTGFGLIFSRFAPYIRGWALLAGLALSIIAFIQGLRPPVVNEYEIKIPDLPAEADGLIIAAISDLHVGTLLGPAWLTARVDQVNELQPDLIVMIGDLVEGDHHEERSQKVESALKRLTAPLGIWAVTGNHERYSGIDGCLELLDRAGIVVLRNEWREIRPGLVVAGVDDPSIRQPNNREGNRIEQALTGRPADAATIFLSHRPEYSEEVAASKVGLMLCGHTHGGQIWPFSYISGMANSLLVGKYEINGMPVIVGRGTGTWGPRMRLWAPGEILLITLRRT